MGTHSITAVKCDGKTLCTMYLQFDGYPSGHGKDLYDFLKSKRLVNGLLVGGDRENLANGPGCLAAQMIAHFKEGAGGCYLVPEGQTEEWTYVVVLPSWDRLNDPIRIQSSDGEMDLTLDDFGKWCDNPEGIEE